MFVDSFRFVRCPGDDTARVRSPLREFFTRIMPRCVVHESFLKAQAETRYPCLLFSLENSELLEFIVVETIFVLWGFLVIGRDEIKAFHACKTNISVSFFLFLWKILNC